MKKLLWNPYYYFDESKLFYSGIFITIAGILLSFFFNILQDGIFDLHYSNKSFFHYALAPLINIATLTIILSLGAKWVNKKSRIIDIVNVAMVARWPLYIIIPILGNSFIQNQTESIANTVLTGENISFTPTSIIALTIISICSLSAMAYFTIQLFLGFKVASHANNIKHYILFAALLIIAEILSIIIFLTIN